MHALFRALGNIPIRKNGISQEIGRRTPRKLAIQIPAKIARRFERDISSGPTTLSFPTSSTFCTFAWYCEGVGRSESLSEDMAVGGQRVARLAVGLRSAF